MDPVWEVDRNLFVISETLGEGAFGVVVKANASGLVRGEEHHETVAIKMLKGMFFSLPTSRVNIHYYPKINKPVGLNLLRFLNFKKFLVRVLFLFFTFIKLPEHYLWY